MSYMLGCSNGTVAIATAMVFSSTALFLATARQFYGNQTSQVHDQTPPSPPILRSCLSSSGTFFFSRGRKLRLIFFSRENKFLFCSCDAEGMKKQRRKKKKVRFAENVKDTKGNGEEYRKRMELSRRTVPEIATKPGKTGSICGISTLPANRMALYNGILRDRSHRTQCSYWLFFLDQTKSIYLCLKIVVGGFFCSYFILVAVVVCGLRLLCLF